MVTSHSVTLSGLQANTTYNYRVKSGGVTSVNSTFTTQSNPVTPTPTSGGKFNIGDRVKVSVPSPYTVTYPYAQASQTGNPLGSYPVGSMATVTGGPTSSGGHVWYQFAYDSALNNCSVTSAQTCKTGWDWQDDYAITTRTTPTPTPTTYSLSVAKAGTGSGTISGGGVNCGSTCSLAGVTSGTSITLTAPLS